MKSSYSLEPVKFPLYIYFAEHRRFVKKSVSQCLCVCVCARTRVCVGMRSCVHVVLHVPVCVLPVSKFTY